MTPRYISIFGNAAYYQLKNFLSDQGSLEHGFNIIIYVENY
jgi:hypothetical protein